MAGTYAATGLQLAVGQYRDLRDDPRCSCVLLSNGTFEVSHQALWIGAGNHLDELPPLSPEIVEDLLRHVRQNRRREVLPTCHVASLS